jgi:hypothetical protein
MTIILKYNKLRHAALHTGMFLLLLLVLSFAPARAEEAELIENEPDTEQHDLYYDAMLRSIELDMSRWKSFSRSMESGPWFYDTRGLKRDGSLVTVLVTVYPHPQRTELYRSVHSEHTKIRKIVFVTEIDCAERSYRQPLISVHGYYKELLAEHAFDGNKQDFSPIKPGTTTDTLRSLVCGPDKKRRK